MTRAKKHTLGVVAGGLVPLVLVFAAGCSDLVQSRANTGGGQSSNDGAADDETTAELTKAADKSAGGSSVKKESPSERPTSENVAAKDDGAPARSPPAGRKTTREISFDTLKFDIEKGGAFKRSMLTSTVEKLDGGRVRIRGYMLPSFQQSGITQFVLVRDNMECCFGPGAALYDCVIVEMVNDESCEFSVRPIAVEGMFSIREFKGPDDIHLAIFHLDGERVR